MNDPKQNDHSDFDGIEEQDNPLPKWWLFIFYGSVIFAALYYAHYEFGPGLSLTESYQLEVKAREAARAQAVNQYTPPAEDELLALAKDAGAVASGKTAFVAKCASCHGAEGQGGIGPNLTDDYWLHGASPSEIFTVLREGVLDKGMPSWKGLVPDPEMRAITGFILSIHGSNPPNPKAPQGTQATK